MSFLPASVWWVRSVSVELVLTCLFLPMSVRRNLLMSVWTELACFLASVCLMSSIGVCLKCFPLLVCQYLSSGPTWFLSEFYLKIYRCLLICCPMFWTVLLERTLSFPLVCIFIFSPVSAWVSTQVSSLFWGCQLVVFLWVFQDSVARSIRSPSGFLPQSFFIKTVQVRQLASKDTNRSWVGFKDSKGKNKVILTSLSWNNVFNIEKSDNKIC